MGSGLGGMMMSGMALGAGSAVGHAAVNSMMGTGRGASSGSEGGQQQQMAPAQDGGYAPMEQQQQQPAQENPCQAQSMNFMSCLRSNGEQISMCQDYMNMMMDCEKSMQMGGSANM